MFPTKPHTSGALFWQFNDCWPGTSWSVIDYYCLPKAAYHYARKFFSPILLTIDHDPGQDLELWALNDRLYGYEDEVEFVIYDFLGKKQYAKTFSVSVPANSSVMFASLAVQDVLNGLDPAKVVCVVHSLQRQTEDNFYYLRDHKDMLFPAVQMTVKLDEVKQELSITTDHFARMVKIELDMEQLVMNDNFFDLLPNETKTIRVTQAQGKAIPWETLAVTAINSIEAKEMNGDVSSSIERETSY
jgi:beta-mannosidase